MKSNDALAEECVQDVTNTIASLPIGKPVELDGWIKEAFGLPKPPSHILNDDDWSFVVKMHGYIEASINQLLTAHFNDPRLNEILQKMDMGHDKRGKLGLVKALELLPPGAWTFVKLLADLRSTVVHNIKWLDLDLAEHLQHKDRKEGWKYALNWWQPDRDKKGDEYALMYPRNAIFGTAAVIMSQAAVRKTAATARHRLQQFLVSLGENSMTERTKGKPPKSSPKKPPKCRQLKGRRQQS